MFLKDCVSPLKKKTCYRMGKQSEILSHSLHLDGEGNRANVIYAVKPLQQYISNKEINPMRE